jgi:hypothetical protein
MLITIISHGSCMVIYCYFTPESLIEKLFFIKGKLVLD